MTTKKHCDICDSIVGVEGGHIDCWAFSAALNSDSMDLCYEHYNNFRKVLTEWEKFEKGFVASWPTR